MPQPTFLTHYALVRADLPVGIQAAQLIHAAAQSAAGMHCSGTYAVALHVRDEAALMILHKQLINAGIQAHLIVEDDEPYARQAMAIGIEPCERSTLKRFLSKYNLVKAPVAQSLEHPVSNRKVGGETPSGRATHMRL